MTLWDALDSNPAYKHFLISRGWNATTWNDSRPKQRTAELVAFHGGLQNDSLIAQLPGAVAETVGGYRDQIATAATATGKTIAKAAISTLVALGLTTLIAYRKPITQVFKKVGT